jgi:hypothetical protein
LGVERGYEPFFSHFMPKNHEKRPFLDDKNFETKSRFSYKIHLNLFWVQVKIEIASSDIYLHENSKKLISE